MTLALHQEETELSAALSSGTAGPEAAVRLCVVLQLQGKPIPLAIEETTLHYHLQNEPDRLDLLQRLSTVLERQGKPVPFDLEERTLRRHLATQPDRADLLERLSAIIGKQNRVFPLDLQEQLLRESVRKHPDRADVRRRLEVWEAGLRGRANEARSAVGAFLVVANMRSGTTWTQMMLAELGDVATDYEFKWAPTYPAHLQHMVVPAGPFSCRSALEALSQKASIVGSKLVFDPVRMSERDYAGLAHTIEDDIAIIHLVRRYFDVANSYYRGFFHVLARPDREVSGVLHNSLRDSTRAFENYAKEKPERRRRLVAIGEAAKLFQTLLRHDLWAARLRWRNPYLRVSYRNIARDFPRMVRFIGSTAGAEVVDRIVASPPTVKLPQDNLIANRWQISLLALAFDAARELGLALIFVRAMLRNRQKAQNRG